MSTPEPIYSQMPGSLLWGPRTVTIDLDVDTVADVEASLDRWERLLRQQNGEDTEESVP
jgi:hypothetical protein